MADSFAGQEAQSVIVKLTPGIDLDFLQPFLSENVKLREQDLEISTVTDKDSLNQLWATLGNNHLIDRIEIKENHLKEVFMKG